MDIQKENKNLLREELCDFLTGVPSFPISPKPKVMKY